MENERNKLDTLFLHMTDGVVAFSRDGAVIQSNPAAEQLLGRAIPIGGSAINRDIRSQSIPEKHVETLKCRFGSALAELAPDTLVNIKGRTARESKDIPRRNLATIIEARMHDIVEYVVQELQASGYYEKLAYGVVLSGGTARLQGVDELFRRATGMEVRIADTAEGFLPAPEDLPTVPNSPP